MLAAYAWFSVGMGLTALTNSTTMFGLLRFLTGLGVGALGRHDWRAGIRVRAGGEEEPCNAITYCGVPIGSLLAALLAILLLESIGWRGMFWIGALPLVTLLPLAFFKMPESPVWLAARGRVEEARAIAEKTGLPSGRDASRRPWPGRARPVAGRASPACSARHAFPR